MSNHLFETPLQISTIEANRSVRDALLAKLRSRRSPERISVTDLLSPKQAYFKRKHPEIVPRIDRQQVMWEGTGFHQLFETLVSSEEYIEQFVELEDIVGKIDIYEDYPVEIKTTSNLGEDFDLKRKRPGYIEQLGMYCGMTNDKEGKIIIYQRQRQENSRSPLLTYHLRFSDPEAIRDEMFRRSSLLQEALSSENPGLLPKCPWCSNRCEFHSVCDWQNSTVSIKSEIVRLAEEVFLDQEASETILLKLKQSSSSQSLYLSDLVLPRKAYFRSSQNKAPADGEIKMDEAGEQLSAIERQGLPRVIRDALLYGNPGEVKRVAVSFNGLKDRILLHQGLPTLIRANNFQSVVERERLPELFPHYFLRLGFECALCGSPRGRLLLYYRNVPKDDGKLLVYDISFRSLESLKAEVLNRIDLLGKAGNLEDLPSCPSWMCHLCKYVTPCQGN